MKFFFFLGGGGGGVRGLVGGEGAGVSDFFYYASKFKIIFFLGGG